MYTRCDAIDYRRAIGSLRFITQPNRKPLRTCLIAKPADLWLIFAHLKLDTKDPRFQQSNRGNVCVNKICKVGAGSRDTGVIM